MAGAWVLCASACSDDSATGPGDSSGTSSDMGSSDGSDPDTSASTSTQSSSADTTCSDDCADTSVGTTSTGDSTGSTGDGTSSEGSSTTAGESSSSEGPMGMCGDGILQGDEDCDDTVETATCDDDCTFADCGDANVNETAGEICDAGGESLNCDDDCTLPVCGDGVTNESDNEICDDAGDSSTCDADCTLATCGDGTQNIAASEACDDGDGVSGDGCSSSCLVEGNFGGTCRIVDGTQWCFDDDVCGQGCDDVCSALGLTIEPDDAAWFAAQDTPEECQAISDAFELLAPIDFAAHPLGCVEDEGLGDVVGGGLQGSLLCSSDATCPAAHRAAMDDDGINCNLPGARRSVCPCAGEFCGNGVVEGAEECDDANTDNTDGCHSSCLFTPPSCMQVGAVQWCYDPIDCGDPCEQVCASLGLSLDITDADWLAAQDTVAECQEIADALGMTDIMLSAYEFACLEEQAADDIPFAGIQGRLYCSTNALCPAMHRTDMDGVNIPCDNNQSFRSICPCN